MWAIRRPGWSKCAGGWILGRGFWGSLHAEPYLASRSCSFGHRSRAALGSSDADSSCHDVTAPRGCPGPEGHSRLETKGYDGHT
jgi:hypothetical protein